MIYDAIDNKKYVIRYYHIDDAIRNRGYLTLIHPLYIDPFSKLLKLARHNITEEVAINTCMIPSKDQVINRLNKQMAENEVMLVGKICKLGKTRLPNVHISKQDMQSLI